MDINPLSTYSSQELFLILLVFCRVGSALMLVPGLGEAYVSPRIRLLFALAMSVALSGTVRHLIPELPSSPLVLAVLVTQEVTIGVFLGFVVRVMFATLHTAGMIVAMHSSLATAMMFDANQSTQGSVFGILLNTAAVMLFFSTGLYYSMLVGFADSYALFSAGDDLPSHDMAIYMAKLVTESFNVAFKLSSPVVIISLVVYVGSGVLARLMPSMQVFFVIMPLQILISLVIFTVTLSAALLGFFDYLEYTLIQLFH